MANTSILAAFERMWQHVVAIAGAKSDLDHNHDDKYYTEVEVDTKLDTINTSISNITSGSVSVAKAKEAVSATSATSATNAEKLGGQLPSYYAKSSDIPTGLLADKSVISESDLDSALAEKVNAASEGNHSHSNKTVLDTITSTKVSNWDSSLDSAKEYTDSVVSGKADTSHTHSISDVSSLQTTLDGKVPNSRKINGKVLSYDITLSASDVGAATSTHTHDGYVNQNAFSNVKVGSTTVAADTTTDTLEIAAGTGISVSGDATNDKVTITNSGVRSVGTGSSNGTISVNTNGSSTDVAVKGLGSAAYTNSTAYDKSGTAQTKADAALASAKSYTDTAISNLINSAPETLDTLGEIATAMANNADVVAALNDAIGTKVDKVDGKGLSTNDYTTDEKNKLADIASGAQVNQNAFSNIKVGSTTIAADTTTDTLTLVAGSNITLTPDASGDSVTITAQDTTYTLGSFGVTATAAELNKLDGVTATTEQINYLANVESDIQEQLDGKLSTSGTAAKAKADASGNTITSTYMTKENPSGTGSLSLNRKDSTTAAEYSVAEGYNNTATGRASHAEGEGTTASSQAAHAEGYNTTASSYYAHAEGNNTTASSRAAHAEGQYTVASANSSHAEGHYTKASSASQHVQGKFNIEDKSSTYAHIVGNGESDTERSNAHTLDWDGNAWFAGDVYVGGTGQSSGTKLVKSTDTIPIAKGGTGATTAAGALTNLGLTATATELNYMDGVTSNVQTQLDGKLAKSAFSYDSSTGTLTLTL